MPRPEGTKDRRFRRFDVNGVDGSLRFSTDVKILDISAGGMQVSTSSHLTVGRRYSFKLNRSHDAMKISGRIAWCELTGKENLAEDEVVPKYTAGIAFDSTLSQEGSTLADFLSENITIELERRIYGRFKLPDGEPVTVDTKVEFAVLRLSLGGMLIEAELGAELEQVFPMELHIGDSSLTAEGRVAYVEEPGDGKTASKLGVEFLGMNDEDRAELEHFIEREFAQDDPLLREE